MITLTDVAKRYDDHLAVDGINLTISEGEIVGLLGPNGAGKTTTLRMITGVMPPSHGTITINGQSMKDHDKQIKKSIGFLPENNPLYDDVTVEELLLFWAQIKGIPRDKQQEAINFVVAHTGIADVYYRPINHLSKGYRQRVGLSQAILTKPAILVLDEPTEGLDPNQRRDIQQLIQSLGEKRTVIVSSHVLSEIARICNRIIIIHKGKIVADDTPEHLQQSGGSAVIIEAEIIGKDVVETLKKIKGVKHVNSEGKHQYRIETGKQSDLRKEIFQTAVKKDWTLLTMYQKETDLEDIFSDLTKE